MKRESVCFIHEGNRAPMLKPVLKATHEAGRASAAMLSERGDVVEAGLVENHLSYTQPPPTHVQPLHAAQFAAMLSR